MLFAIFGIWSLKFQVEFLLLDNFGSKIKIRNLCGHANRASVNLCVRVSSNYFLAKKLSSRDTKCQFADLDPANQLKWSLIFVAKPSLLAADRSFDVQNVQVKSHFSCAFSEISSTTKWALNFSKSRPLMKFPAIMFWLVQGSVFTALEIIRLTLRNGSGRLLMSFFLTFLTGRYREWAKFDSALETRLLILS